MAKQPKWTKSELELLENLYDKGLSDEEIAVKLNRSKLAVFERRHKLKLTNVEHWDDEKIKSELLKCIEQLMIDRMPTAEELKNIGRNDLHCKISRTKKYSGWARELGLNLTSCETRTGQHGEDRVQKFMELTGFKVERMSTKFPYDLLVNDCVKVDVKCAKPNFHNHSRVHTFGINKEIPTCDVYVIAAMDEQERFERVLVIPSHLLKMKSLNIGQESKWNCYLGRWDIIESYAKFFKEVL